jgi:hypothetical protein
MTPQLLLARAGETAGRSASPDRMGSDRRSRASVGTLPATYPPHPTVQTFRNWFAGIRCPAFDQQRRSSFRDVADRDDGCAPGESFPAPFAIHVRQMPAGQGRRGPTDTGMACTPMCNTGSGNPLRHTVVNRILHDTPSARAARPHRCPANDRWQCMPRCPLDGSPEGSIAQGRTTARGQRGSSDETAMISRRRPGGAIPTGNATNGARR